MPLESANTIAQLDEQWPNGSDSVDRGDDHIRLVKSVLKKAFPGPTGNGFSTPLTVDPATLNALAQTLSDMKATIVNAQAIGNIIFRDDAVDPATLYPGTTWALLTGDACVALATAQNVGQTSGDNDPVVPVQLHSHSAAFAGTPLPPHNHDSGLRIGNRIGVANHSPNYSGFDTTLYTNAVSAGTPSGTVTVSPAGQSGATINVRGTRKYLCAWKRVK